MTYLHLLRIVTSASDCGIPTLPENSIDFLGFIMFRVVSGIVRLSYSVFNCCRD